MYKLLLSWRYLRTRYIALASIISVTLGVATLIVVNSVMEGFSAEMHSRLHDILSDIVIESVGIEGLQDPRWHEQEIRKVVGDDLEAITSIVRAPAMINYPYRGRWVTQQVMLIGVDEATYAKVSAFQQYLKHPQNRQQLSFLLREGGYDSVLPEGSGWEHRREWVKLDREYQTFYGEQPGSTPIDNDQSSKGDSGPNFRPLPSVHPLQNEPGLAASAKEATFEEKESLASESSSAPSDEAALPVDPFAAGQAEQEGHTFDEMVEQHTGVILGIALASYRFRDDEQEIHDEFLCRPGDNVQITMPTSGRPPRPISDTFTVVDIYESKMSEYDSSFAFVPLAKLQQLRGMIDPLSGVASVTSIQIKLREGADLNMVRDKLQARFPPSQAPYRIQTWREMQGPLLAAVRLETTILNILLFMIIAVAGFGILATFFMIVVEKTRDIGILKALGAPSRGIMSIFLSYGFSLGVLGSGAGVVLGLLFVAYINDIADLIGLITGQEVFDQTVYYFQEIPTIVKPFTIGWVIAGSVLIAVLASVLPALRAARLHPVEALRYE